MIKHGDSCQPLLNKRNNFFFFVFSKNMSQIDKAKKYDQNIKDMCGYIVFNIFIQ